MIHIPFCLFNQSSDELLSLLILTVVERQRLSHLQSFAPGNQSCTQPVYRLCQCLKHLPLLGMTSLGFANALFVLPLRFFVVISKV